MPFNIFKEVKVRCNVCQSIVISKSDTEWTTCECGSCGVMGLKSFVRTAGKCTDMSVLDFTSVPKHNGWDKKREEYYGNQQ